MLVCVKNFKVKINEVRKIAKTAKAKTLVHQSPNFNHIKADELIQ
jgi:hypothetical protein